MTKSEMLTGKARQHALEDLMSRDPPLSWRAIGEAIGMTETGAIKAARNLGFDQKEPAYSGLKVRDKDRAIVNLVRKGRTSVQIAAHLGASPQGVRNRLHQMRRAGVAIEGKT